MLTGNNEIAGLPGPFSQYGATNHRIAVVAGYAASR